MKLCEMTAQPHETSTGNALLDALSSRERSKLSAVDVFLSVGQVLCDREQQVRSAYFPVNCVISCVHLTRGGTAVETALIGNEGMFDIAIVLASGLSSARAVVQFPGRALRVSTRTLQTEFAHAGGVQRELLGYTDTLLSQISQTAICNRLHQLEQRLCRWLLLCHDRLDRDEFLATQEMIANMLGGRRESITVVARRLQDRGAIRYSRGHITIINRECLEQLACECYEVVNARLAKTQGSWNFSAAESDNQLARDKKAC